MGPACVTLSKMFVVAIMELGTSIEAEAAALAAELGTTAYEERLMLAAGLPAVALRTTDRTKATELLASIRRRGHGAVACDASRVIGNESMVLMRGFTLDPAGVGVPSRPGDPLPYSDISALIRATIRTRTETRKEVSEKKFSVGRTLLTGGLMMTKTVAREETHVASDREQVLYLFRASGDTPWILRERATAYTGLGSAAGASSFQNFMATITRLRELAPQAGYDERLTAPGLTAGGRAMRVKTTSGAGTESVSTSSASGVDLLAHLIALWLTKGGRR